MKYKIGELSRLLGVTPNTLRYYEKMGMIAPEKDGSTNYRYYSTEDIVWLLVIKFWQASGLSIEDSVKVACKMDMDHVLEVLDSHRKVLMQKQIRARKLYEKFSTISAYWHSRQKMDGRCTVVRFPPIRYLLFLEDDNSPFTSDMTDIARKWVSYIPFAGIILFVEDPLLGTGDTPRCRWGLYFYEEEALQLEIDSHPLVCRAEQRLCVHSETVIDIKGRFDVGGLKRTVDYARKHNFELIGGAFGMISGLMQKGGESLRVMDMYVPVRDD